FLADAPVGNVPLGLHGQLAADPGAARVVPLNLGDSYRGFYVVATTRAYLDLIGELAGRPAAIRAPGRLFERPFDAVLGATAARQLDLKEGDRFTSTHGLVELPADLAQDHAAQPYIVVGVLEPTRTPADRAILTPLETAWAVHGQSPPAGWKGAAPDPDHAGAPSAREITAMVVQGRSYADLMRLSATVGRSQQAQAIFPARIVTRLFEYLRVGEEVVLALAWLTTVVALLATALSMLAATLDRRRQFATLRALGAGPWLVARVALLEAMMVAAAGALIGLLAGHGAAAGLAVAIERTSGLALLPAAPGLTDLAIWAVALGLGALAGAVPAFAAYRQDVASHLAPSL
ncbi:MAG TPA: ABC transporter permease, partial [Burkholderiales bacterium]